MQVGNPDGSELKRHTPSSVVHLRCGTARCGQGIQRVFASGQYCIFFRLENRWCCVVRSCSEWLCIWPGLHRLSHFQINVNVSREAGANMARAYVQSTPASHLPCFFDIIFDLETALYGLCLVLGLITIPQYKTVTYTHVSHDSPKPAPCPLSGALCQCSRKYGDY